MDKATTRLVLLLTLGVACPPLEATNVKFRVMDPSGACFSKVLVIVRSLEGRGEIDRELTDRDGHVRPVDLSPGVYQVIASYPYGGWDTSVKEFVVGSRAVQLELVLVPAKIGGYLLTKLDLRVQVVAADGEPVSGADLMARDLEAKYFFWAKTDDKGWAMISVPLDGAEISAVYRGQVHTQEVNIKSHLSNCYQHCAIERFEQLKKVRHSITIRLP